MNQLKLNNIKIDEIKKQAKEELRRLGFIDEIPIANDIFTILDKLNIILLEYPIEAEVERSAFSAAIMYSEENNNSLTFIGLNTADYFDKQIFAIAHELYHYFTKSGSHLSRQIDIENDIVEIKANRFAAEFLLPENKLESIVLNDFKTSNLKNIKHKTLLRFIARLHCTWQLPFRSIVKRLFEIDLISKTQYDGLYSINERSPNSDYYKIGQAINKEIFDKLNHPTNNTAASHSIIEIIIRNYEDGIIDEDSFIKTLSLFNLKPSNFGYDIMAADSNLEEFEVFFNGEENNEN